MKHLIKLTVFFICLCTANSVLAQTEEQQKDTAKELIIYGSNDCHYCTDTKSFLEDNHIAFIFYDIDTDENALKEMLQKLRKAGISTSNLGIPVVDKHGTLYTNNGDFEQFLQKLK